MANIRPEVEVGGSLRLDMPRAKGEGHVKRQTSEDRGQGSYVRHLHSLDMVRSYNLYYVEDMYGLLSTSTRRSHAYSCSSGLS